MYQNKLNYFVNEKINFLTQEKTNFIILLHFAEKGKIFKI